MGQAQPPQAYRDARVQHHPPPMDAPNGGYGTSQQPLAGTVLCCTAIAPEQRAQLATHGEQMGASIKLDLTSDVTHLIVGSTDSAKYRYVAKSREDVKVLPPAWLEAVRERWIEGDDHLDLSALEAEHRLPTFFGLKVCLTGFDNPEQRRYIQETVDGHGAEYHGDLTKSVTHLIAATPSGKKYEHALSWRMKIVSLEWFQQSLERGMVLDEALYNPTAPVEERGKGAWDRKQPVSPTPGKRTRDTDPDQSLNPFRRKLRRSASTKMGTQSEALWAGITAASLERQQDEHDDWTEHILAKPDNTPTMRAEDGAALPQEPSGEDPVDHYGQPQSLTKNENCQRGIFADRVVCPLGFDKEKTIILQQHMYSQGARVVSASDLSNISSDDLRLGYLVIPHDVKIDSVLVPEHAGSLMNLVTNWWVERCLHGKCLVNPADDVLSRPFEHLDISGFSGLIINSTGFAGIELLHVTKVVTLMGATYDEQLSMKTAVMICNAQSINTPKFKFATDKRIPAVQATWLWECLQSGRLQPYGAHQLNAIVPPQAQKSKPKRTTRHPLDAAPAVLLSEEEQVKLRQRRAQTLHTVKNSGRPHALDLAPSVDAASVSTTDSLMHPNHSTNHTPLDHNDTVISCFDGQASRPLQDISANSPRQRSVSSSTGSKSALRHRSSSAESLIKVVPAPHKSEFKRNLTPDSVIPAPDTVILADTVPVLPPPHIAAENPEEERDYSDMLARLRASRKAAPIPADQADEKKRKRRQLGRATSTRSNQSTGDSSGNMGLKDDEASVLIEQYQPSQELGWDSPGAAKAREQMIKKLGGTVKERRVPVKGIGMVKDAVGESVGRASRKRRG